MIDDLKIIENLNRKVEKMSKRKEQNLMIPIRILSVQAEAKPLGIENTPIFCKVEGLNEDENEGSLISNGDWVFFVDEVDESGFVKLYLFGADYESFVEPDEFKKDFFILC